MGRNVLCAAALLFWAVPAAAGRFEGGVHEESEAALREMASRVVAEWAERDQEYLAALKASRSPEDHQKAIEKRPGPVTEAAKLVAWAERHPQDSLARDVLATVVIHGRFSRAAQQASNALARNHLDLAGDQFLRTAHQVILWPAPVAEKWLRAYLEKSPSRPTRGRACLELALYKKWLAERAHEEMDPEWIAHIEEHFGKGSADYMDSIDSDALLADALSLFDRVGAEFADVEWSGERLADIARGFQFELSRLAIGRTVPEIEAEDLAGVPFKLSQHRGKVVVLVFWATWCVPCMAAIPHERALVKRLAGRPFALLGINGDKDREAARAAEVKHEINWRSWWDAGTGGEPISKTWNVFGWPSVYVLDHKGIIRYKNVRGPELDEAVDRLVRAAERK